MNWHHRLLWAGIVLLIGYGCLLLLVVLVQDNMVYFPDTPDREMTSTPGEVGLAYENVYFSTDDRQRLHAWYIPARKETGTVLFFHGNAGNISHRLESILILNQLNLSVFIFDYRGYGKSSGKPSEQGTYLDAQAAFHYLTAVRHIDISRLIYFGRSLGGAVAAQLAVIHPPKALILESTFTSAPDMARHIFPLFPARWLSRFSYNTAMTMRAIHCPVLIIHSPDDEIIPYKFARKLYKTANKPKQFLAIHGGHNDGFIQSGQIYTKGLKHFLATTLNPDN
jgi:fermentation-respiration switch protein FrsA (DUF1100 family)